MSIYVNSNAWWIRVVFERWNVRFLWDALVPHVARRHCERGQREKKTVML